MASKKEMMNLINLQATVIKRAVALFETMNSLAERQAVEIKRLHETLAEANSILKNITAYTKKLKSKIKLDAVRTKLKAALIELKVNIDNTLSELNKKGKHE